MNCFFCIVDIILPIENSGEPPLLLIQNNLALLNVINVALITMLVLINGAYGYFTWQIVDETRNDRKVNL